MRTPDIEGVATRDGPESCAGTREGAGEALTGVRAGWAIEPRNHHFGVPTPSHEAEGHIAGGASASRRGTPRGLRPCACTESSCARTGRSRARPPVLIAGRAAQGTLRR
jgi:RNA-directed DNA polymerase